MNEKDPNNQHKKKVSKKRKRPKDFAGDPRKQKKRKVQGVQNLNYEDDNEPPPSYSVSEAVIYTMESRDEALLTQCPDEYSNTKTIKHTLQQIVKYAKQLQESDHFIIESPITPENFQSSLTFLSNQNYIGREEKGGIEHPKRVLYFLNGNEGKYKKKKKKKMMTTNLVPPPPAQLDQMEYREKNVALEKIVEEKKVKLLEAKKKNVLLEKKIEEFENQLLKTQKIQKKNMILEKEMAVMKTSLLMSQKAQKSMEETLKKNKTSLKKKKEVMLKLIEREKQYEAHMKGCRSRRRENRVVCVPGKWMRKNEFVG